MEDILICCLQSLLYFEGESICILIKFLKSQSLCIPDTTTHAYPLTPFQELNYLLDTLLISQVHYAVSWGFLGLFDEWLFVFSHSQSCQIPQELPEVAALQCIIDVNGWTLLPFQHFIAI